MVEKNIETKGKDGYNKCMEVYVTNAAALAGREAELLPLLPPDRQEKIRRLRAGEDRRCSMAAGLLLRRFWGNAPLQYAARGKPQAEGQPFFNLSHSGDWAVLAISDAELGIDIEKPGPFREGVARRVFSEEERRFTESDADDRFIFLWTRKEAVVKCLGCGIVHPMSTFSVLEDRVSVDGKALYLQSIRYSGSWLSAASEAPFSLCLREVKADDLLF